MRSFWLIEWYTLRLGEKHFTSSKFHLTESHLSLYYLNLKSIWVHMSLPGQHIILAPRHSNHPSNLVTRISPYLFYSTALSSLFQSHLCPLKILTWSRQTCYKPDAQIKRLAGNEPHRLSSKWQIPTFVA